MTLQTLVSRHVLLELCDLLFVIILRSKLLCEKWGCHGQWGEMTAKVGGTIYYIIVLYHEYLPTFLSPDVGRWSVVGGRGGPEVTF